MAPPARTRVANPCHQHRAVPYLRSRGRGRDLFSAVERLDLEGIVAKRKIDPYAASTTWLKVKNRAYTQMEGRDSFSTQSRHADLRATVLPRRS